MKGTIDNCSVFGYCGDSDGAATLTGKCCAYNFLNNGYFLNPVNQRNFGSDAGLPDKPIYTIDRWVACTESGYAEVQVLPDGVQVRPLETDAVEFQQRFAKNTLKYVTYTAAFCDTDGNITLVKDALTYLPTKPYDIVSIRVTKPTKFVWAAMYEGDYTIDTLPPYVQKGYDVELAECRRYYRRFPKSATASYSGYAFNDTTARITLEGVGGMRIPPTVRFFEDFSTAYSYLYPGSHLVGAVSTVSMTNNDISIVLTSSELTPNTPVVFRPNNCFELSAEL